MTTLAKTRITYNRDTRDYDLFVAIDDGAEQYIGSAANHHDGQSRIDDYVFHYYAGNHTPEAAAQVLARPEEVIVHARPAEPAPEAIPALLPIGTWVRAWTTSRHEDGGGEVLGWIAGYGQYRDHWTNTVIGPTYKVRNLNGGADVRSADVYQVLGADEVAELFARAIGAYRPVVHARPAEPALEFLPGRILTYCARCGAPGTTDDQDTDYVCPICLATSALTGDPAAAIVRQIHDDPATFQRTIDALPLTPRHAMAAALAAYLDIPIADVVAFFGESRARLGMLS